MTKANLSKAICLNSSTSEKPDILLEALIPPPPF